MSPFCKRVNPNLAWEAGAASSAIAREWIRARVRGRTMSTTARPTDSATDSLLAERFVVRVKVSGRSAALPLEVLARAPIVAILPGMAAAMSLGTVEGEASTSYSLVTAGGTELDPLGSLAEQGVQDGDLLGLSPSVPLTLGTTPPGPGPQARQGLPPLLFAESPTAGVRGPCLASPLGWVFELNDGLFRIGRQTPGQQPEIDLTDLDPECACSRLHAEVRQSGVEFLLLPCRTTNGTLLNGQWLEPGTPVRLQPGDRVEFGLEGVALVFFAPGQAVPPEFFQVPRRSGAK